MGGSIARGLAKGNIISASDITVSNPSQGKLDALTAEFPALHTTHDNQEAVNGAALVILAVKPWLIKSYEFSQVSLSKNWHKALPKRK